MYCDDCHDPVGMELKDYIKTKERLGTVLCPDCRNGAPQTRVPDEVAGLLTH